MGVFWSKHFVSISIRIHTLPMIDEIVLRQNQNYSENLLLFSYTINLLLNIISMYLQLLVEKAIAQ